MTTVYAAPAQNRRAIAAVLGAILLAATALRVYDLNAGLWFDEILTNVLFARLPFESIISTYQSENQHFLYSLLAHASFVLFGESAWALRLPAALFGVASIWALYLLGREVTDAREMLFACALLAFNYTHIWFSQNARGYSGLLFWTILSSWLLLRAMRETRPHLWLFYALSAALGVYTHFTMVFVIFSQFLVFAGSVIAKGQAASRRNLAGLVLGFGGAGFVALLLFSPALSEVLAGMGREESVVESWKNPLWTVLEVLKGMQISFRSGVFAAGGLLVFGAGLLSYLRTKPHLVALLFLSTGIGAATVVALGHHLWPRFFLFAMGFAALIAMRGAMTLAQIGVGLVRLPPAWGAWLGAALCAGMVLVSAMSVPYAYGPKQDYAGAIEFIEANEQAGDLVTTAGLASLPYKEFYGRDWQEITTVDRLNALRAGARRTWLIYTFPTVLESVYPDVMVSIKSDFQVIKEFPGTVGDGSIFVCRADSAAAQKGQ